tara:strand:- start:1380 stop:1535 length:156 start_codon:yes stop_codon:yes gene_type:complete
VRKPDFNKIRIRLASDSSKDRDYILKMSDYDLLYEFTKVFGTSRIPKKEIE